MSTTFAFSAMDTAGRRLKGLEPATSAAALAQTLEARGLLVLEVTQSEPSAVQTNGFGFNRKREVLEVTRALAALLPAGLPLARALTAASHLTSGTMRSAVLDVQAQVERGRSLADALAAYPGLFSPLYIGLIRAGERSGSLDSAFGRLAAQLEREAELRARLLSVSIYPLLLALAGGAAVLVLLLFVIPRFAVLLTDTGIGLPRSTAALLALSTTMRTYWPLLLAALAAIALLGAWARASADGQRVVGHILLRIPIIRAFKQYSLGARFARLMGTLVGGGAPLYSALEDTIASIGDPLARDETARIRDRVREGASLSGTLGHGALFPPLLQQLIVVGEESGRLAEFLTKAADILEERTERALQRVVAAAEPMMIIGFGGIVGFVALSLLQAIYSVNAGALR